MKTIGKILMITIAFAFELLGRVAHAVSVMFMSAAVMVLSAIQD